MALVNKDESTVHIRITVPDINFQTLMVFHIEDTVWAVKQKLLSTIALKDLQDGLNYGLYCLPANGRAGKFLDEERPLKEYPFNSPVGVLEFKYKKRVYKMTPPDAVKMKKLHSPSNLRALMEYVQKGDVDKISALTNRGLDPNFIDRATGETPLTLSATLPRSRTLMLVLVGGGAILDYRNSRSLTPVHVAVLSGNRDAVMTLLDLGASPNYKDGRCLTPLYYSVTRESRAGPQCVQMLLHDRAEISSRDEDGNTELHQGCLNGRVQHIEHLVFYGADMNAQNSRGDTPLHICARYNQEECARVLLFRGADKTVKNNFQEDAYQVAISSEHLNLADIIRCFRREDVVLFQELPTYNEKRRGTISAATLRNLQRSRSNPQLNLLFDTSLVTVNGSASLSSAHQYSSNGFLAKAPRVEPTRPALYTDIEQYSTKRLSSHSSSSARDYEPRVVVLHKDHNGFGFILRGAKSRPGNPAVLDFAPSPDFPSLQYFDFIEENSMAAKAGLRCGDFLLEVNGSSVVNATHEHAVKLIKNAGDKLTLTVIEGRSFQSAASQQVEHLSVDNALAARISSIGSSFKPGPVTGPNNTWSSRSSVEGLEELERLDATLDIYDQDYGRRQSITPFNHLSLSSSKPTAGATMHVTTAELHQPPLGARDNVVLPIEPPVDYLPQLEPEPEPDYDMDDTQELPPPPPPLDMHSSGLNLYVDAPIPPPLPVSAGVPYQYSSGSSSSSLTADNGSSKASEAARRSAIADDSRQRDQAHAALMAAVLRRRNLLESTEGNQIADKIENRVQRSKMLQQTIYRADQSAAETRRSSTATAAGDESSVKSGAGTSSIGGATSDAVNFSAEAERARLDFVRKSASHPALGSSTTSVKVPPPKPQRPDRVSGSVGLNTGQVQPRMGTGQPPGQPGATVGAVVRAPENNVGIMTSNYSPAVNPSNGLKIETYDELSLMSSVSTASTSSSVDHEGSPSHSSSGDSGYAKSMSASPHGDGEQLIIAPPAEFATATVIADVITTPATPAGGLRSVIKQQSNSIVFPARARVSQK